MSDIDLDLSYIFTLYVIIASLPYRTPLHLFFGEFEVLRKKATED